MSTHETPWPAGTPCWVDLSVDDQPAAQEFYAALFGWEYEVTSPEYSGYAMAVLAGKYVGGLGPKMGPAQPSAWTTYLASSDLDETAAAITAAGGVIHAEPMQIGENGRMMIALDTTGAAFGSWQAAEMTGFGRVNEPGAVIWNEQLSRDVPAAVQFYREAFGLNPTQISEGDGATQGMSINEEIVASAEAIGPEVPEQVPAHWQTTFAVTSVDEVLAKALELGGSVRKEPFEERWGRSAFLAGPEGEPFAIIECPAEGYPHSDQAKA
jgi:uncharacterized protein